MNWNKYWLLINPKKSPIQGVVPDHRANEHSILKMKKNKGRVLAKPLEGFGRHWEGVLK